MILAFLPWLDTSRVRSATLPAAVPAVLLDLRRRSASASAGSARKPPEGGYVIAARILTAYYFVHFLVILPLLG